MNAEVKPIDVIAEILDKPSFILLPDGTIPACNLAFRTLLQSGEESYNPRNILEIATDPDGILPGLFQSTDSVLHTTQGYLALKQRTGEPRPYQVSFHAASHFGEACIIGTIRTHKNEENKPQVPAISASETQINFFTIDKEYRITTLNRHLKLNLESLQGKTVEPGQNLLDYLEEDRRLRWKALFDRALAGESLIEEIIEKVNGRLISVEISGHPIIDESGNVSGSAFITQNTSIHKNFERAILESEEKFRQLAENITDSFILRSGQEILYVNPAFKEIYGRNASELISKPETYKEWIHPDDRDRVLKFLDWQNQKIISTFNDQYRIIKPNGSSHWIWHRIFPVVNHDGSIYRSVEVASVITKQKELESDLVNSKAQLKAILDNIPQLAWMKDSTGKYISVNKSFAAYYNLQPEAITGKTDFDFWSESQAAQFKQMDEEVIAKKEQLRFEELTETAAGPRWSETFKTPIFDELGEVVGLAGISIDITERKRLEEELRISEERFRSLLQFSSDAINILNREGKITFESSLDGKISGFSLLQIIGSPAIRYVHEDDRQIFEKAFMEVVNNPAKTVKLEFRSITTAGRIVHVESIFANHLDNPQIRGIVMNSRDITARKMADNKEKSFREAQAFLSCTALDFLSMSSEENLYHYIINRLSEIVRNAVLLAVRFDEAESMLRIEYIKGLDNLREIVRDILGTDPEHIQVKVDEDFRSDLIYNSKHLYTFRNGLFEVFNRQLPMSVTKKIEERLCITEAYGMALMRQGKFYGNILIFMMNDQLIDEKPTVETFLYQASIALHRRQLEQELIKAKERAVESEKIKTAFLANMSHEIRTPMNGILGFAQLLASESITKEDIREYTQVIDSNGKLLISLIDDIIDISKLETGHLNMSPDTIHLNQFLDDIYSSVFTDALRAEKKDVNFYCVKAFDDDASTIETDPVRLRQIINNLIANAVKFTEKGSIEIGYGLKDLNTLLFHVKDSGIGIQPDKKQIIFDRFVQADLSATRKYGGSGLGLAISKGLVEMMGGTIWVESVAGKGSTFYFTHPYTPMNDLKPGASSLEDNKAFNGKEKTVLVVEDDKFSYKYLEAILKRYQISILHAVNGLEAVEMCKQHPEIDLVLMDIQLPNLSGYDATRQIRETYKNLPIIAQTANAFDEDRIKCLDAGCNEYLAKPVNLSTLLNILAKYLF